MNILQKLAKELTSFPPVTDNTKKQMAKDAMDIALNFGPMGLSIKTPIAKSYPKGAARLLHDPSLSLSEINSEPVWDNFRLWAAPSEKSNVILGEISDMGAKLDPSWFDMLSFSKYHGTSAPRLRNILAHPELYDDYPGKLGNTKIDSTLKANGYYNPKTDTIALNPLLSQQQQLSTILHEIQHAIQTNSNLPYNMRGASSKYYADALKGIPASSVKTIEQSHLSQVQNALLNNIDNNMLRKRFDALTSGSASSSDNIDKLAYDLYRANPGEVLANMPFKRLYRDSAEHPLQTLMKMGFPYETWTKASY